MLEISSGNQRLATQRKSVRARKAKVTLDALFLADRGPIKYQ